MRKLVLVVVLTVFVAPTWAQPPTPFPAPPATAPTAPPPVAPAPYVGPAKELSEDTEVVLTTPFKLNDRLTLVNSSVNVGLALTAVGPIGPMSVALPANTNLSFVVLDRGNTLPAGTYRIGKGTIVPYDFPLPVRPTVYNVAGIQTTAVDAVGALTDGKKNAAENARAAATAQAAANAAGTTASEALAAANAAKTTATAAQAAADVALNLAKKNGDAISALAGRVDALVSDVTTLKNSQVRMDATGRVYNWQAGVDGVSRWYSRDPVTGCYFVLP